MKNIQTYLNESLSSDVHDATKAWFKNYWLEKLKMRRKAKFIKKAMKKYKLSQQDLAGFED